jgi:MFS family permease
MVDRPTSSNLKAAWKASDAGFGGMACGVVLLALVTRPWHVYAAFAVMSVGWATMSGAAINIIVAPWFDRRRGLAVSWALNGASAGGIIIAPLLTFLTARFGCLRNFCRVRIYARHPHSGSYGGAPPEAGR